MRAHLSKVIQEESESIPHCRATCKFPTDGQITFVMLGHHGITDPLPMLVYSLDEQVTTNGDIYASSQQWLLHAVTSILDSRDWFHTESKRKEHTTYSMYWFDLKIARDEGLVFRQTMSHAIVFNDSMPSDCLTTVVLCSHKILVLFQTRQSVPQVAPKVTLCRMLPKISPLCLLTPLNQAFLSQQVEQKVHGKIATGLGDT